MCKGDFVWFVNIGKEYEVDEIGVFKMMQYFKDKLEVGNVGYIIIGIKEFKEIKVGDIIIMVECFCEKVIQGFEDVKFMVFVGIFLFDNDDFEDLCDSLEKLQFNDVFLVFELEIFVVLGFGFCCGFLGMLYFEIVQECFYWEFDMDVIMIVFNVFYNLMDKFGEEYIVCMFLELFEQYIIEVVEEFYIMVQIIIKFEFIGMIMIFCMEKWGMLIKQYYFMFEWVELLFDLLLVEIVFDFCDCFKLVFRGYVSFDYQLIEYWEMDLVKLDICLNGEFVDVFFVLVYWFKVEVFGW